MFCGLKKQQKTQAAKYLSDKKDELTTSSCIL